MMRRLERLSRFWEMSVSRSWFEYSWLGQDADLHLHDLVLSKPELLQRAEMLQVFDFLFEISLELAFIHQQHLCSLTRILFAPSSKFLIKVNSSKPSMVEILF